VLSHYPRRQITRVIGSATSADVRRFAKLIIAGARLGGHVLSPPAAEPVTKRMLIAAATILGAVAAITLIRPAAGGDKT